LQKPKARVRIKALLWLRKRLAWEMSGGEDDRTEARMWRYCSIFWRWSAIAAALARALSMASSARVARVAGEEGLRGAAGDGDG
jgi:anti-sigma-K factor RskA